MRGSDGAFVPEDAGNADWRTLGRLLQDGVTDVRIQGEPVRVRARVRSAAP